MSAKESPACGRPVRGKLEIFTITGRRSSREGSSTTSPVSGLTLSGKSYSPDIVGAGDGLPLAAVGLAVGLAAGSTTVDPGGTGVDVLIVFAEPDFASPRLFKELQAGS